MAMEATWFGEQAFAKGRRPCVAVNKKGVAVVVYAAPTTDELSCRVGSFGPDGRTMVWSAEQKFDDGRNPSVSINDKGTVVAVFETDNVFTRRMFYRVGVVSGTSVVWGQKNGYYDTGFTPSVGVNNNDDVAEVHQSGNVVTSVELKCWYGKLDLPSKTIAWSGNALFTTGSEPSVSLNNKGQFLVTMKTRGDGWGLWYQCGTLDLANKSLRFGQENPSICDGYSPHCALTDDGAAVMVYTAPNLFAPYFRQIRVGRLQAGNTVSWGDGNVIASGVGFPSVAVDGYALCVGQQDNYILGSQTGFVLDNPAHWMASIASFISTRTLRSLILPGSHDSGTAEITSSSNFSPDAPSGVTWLPKTLVAPFAKAQIDGLGAQLANGIRYLDLRVAPEGSDLKFVHSMYGGLVETGIDEIAAFVQANDQEILILDFQHFYAMTDAFHDSLAAYIMQKLGSVLVPPGPPDQQIVAKLWSAKRRVVVLYADGDGGARILGKEPLFWPRQTYVNSPWANTDDMPTLKTYLDNASASPPVAQFFVMQGVLTPAASSYATYSTLEYLARTNNGTIVGWALNDWRKRALNILMVDYATSHGDVVPAAVKLNIG